jgi:polar amino acid transport system permease protein
MIRPLGVNINALIKATALVAAISVVELTYTAQRYHWLDLQAVRDVS